MMKIFYCDHRTWTVIVIAVIARLKNYQRNLELVDEHSGDWDHKIEQNAFTDLGFLSFNFGSVKAELRGVETTIF